MDSAWFHAFIERCSHQQKSALPSVEEWVAAHDGAGSAADAKDAHGDVIKGAAKGVTEGTNEGDTKAIYSARNDARTLATATGSGLDLGFPRGLISSYNVFKDPALHDQAAATIASASQRRSKFNADMSLKDGVARERFRAYLNDFVAPHWLMTYYKEHTIYHESSNHYQFVIDLVNIMVEGVKAAGGDAEAAKKTEQSVKGLAGRLSSRKTKEETLTIFSSFWMHRPNASGPVVYGIFYTSIHGRYKEDGKATVLSSSISTYSVIFELLSGVLIQHEAAYNALLKTSVMDWLKDHRI